MADAEGFAVEGALDELYSARPEDFTALRTELAARAKKSGDAAAAKRITGSRRPTAAAYIVNALVLGSDARSRLSELGARLREAHGAMDGEAIRTLTGEQRRLVDELARAGFAAAGVEQPSGSLRDDVTATLQAAIADPEVAERLGRLTKAEQWSGFGEFSFTAAVSSAAKSKTSTPKAVPKAASKPAAKPAPKDIERERQRQRARADVTAAERAKADADAALTELQSDLAAARLRLQDARRRLEDAEEKARAAEDAYDAAKQVSRDAAAAVKAAKARRDMLP